MNARNAWTAAATLAVGAGRALAAKGAPELEGGLDIWSLIVTVVAIGAVSAIAFKKSPRARQR